MPPIVIDIPDLTPVNAVPLLIVCGFALFDVLLGLAKAFATNTFTSEKMRLGLWHKMAEIAVVVLAMALEIATQFMDLQAVGMESIPVASVVAAYVVLMEVGSLLESIGEINPDLKGSGLFRRFDVMRGGDDDGDGE